VVAVKLSYLIFSLAHLLCPRKVNPVLCESVLLVAAHVIGCDATIALCGRAGNFELNAMMPVMALRLLESISFSAAVMQVFTDKCIKAMQASKERCAELVEPQFGARNSSRPSNRL
jgi:fumarate hydratase class II